MWYFVALCVVLLLLWLHLDNLKPLNFPPGPKWYPIVGSALSIMNARNKTGMLCKAVEHIAQDYPDHRGVIGFKIGKDKAVMAINAESLKEMMNNEDFDGRPTGIFYETRTWGLRRGVLLTDEQFWQEQRRFIVRHLKEFGFARKGMTEIIQNEAAHIRKDFEELIAKGQGKATVQMQGAFSVYVLNTLWLMMAGVRYSKDNDDLRYLQALLHELFTNIDMMGALFSHFPYLRFVAPRLSGYRQFVEIHECMHKFIGAEVERHQKNFNPDDEPRDLMDVYLHTLQNNNAPSDSFSREQLLAVCLDMFIAGSETTTKTLDFSFLYIVRNPKVMRRIQEEIDDVIGRNRLPTLEDRASMPYSEATTLEGLRLFMSNTFGIPHRALKDTTLCGYHIPKDTMLVGMFRGMMLDENLWENPTQFNPERFLKDGKIHIPAQYHPFGVGKHRCMGELMAKSNLFLFLTTTLQSFDLLLPDGAPIPSDIPIDGATPSVRKYHVAIRARH
ncbi:probable cytochrome P450 303a1 isoform X2 [Anopheles arabiensis]|uniref:Cytochrome P450 n=4 Tax=gambiae species complex TaxID=44542 RepID=A0A6E8VZH6_ANOCL|nr:probable cytochrome P450 303a1 isoform X2 [Anopheles arabiensis]XP_040238723.1 probable cytochrome P450 303a1 [Anopheles coluzzii]